MLEEGAVVHHPKWGVGEVEAVDKENIYLNFCGDRRVVMQLYSHLLRDATDLEKQELKLSKLMSVYDHAHLLQTHLDWLSEAGEKGVMNDCGCAKNEYWNYTCSCRTLVKLYHRFSRFKDDLIHKCGYNIIDEELPNGKHKTILLPNLIDKTAHICHTN